MSSHSNILNLPVAPLKEFRCWTHPYILRLARGITTSSRRENCLLPFRYGTALAGATKATWGKIQIDQLFSEALGISPTFSRAYFVQIGPITSKNMQVVVMVVITAVPTKSACAEPI